jgi:predicted secreted protein
MKPKEYLGILSLILVGGLLALFLGPVMSLPVAAGKINLPHKDPKPPAARLVVGEREEHYTASVFRALNLSTADNGRQVELVIGEWLAVSLPAYPSTGYVWKVAQVDEEILRPAGGSYFRWEARPLASNVQVLRFEAVSAGRTDLKLIYDRPDMDDGQAIQAYRLDVIVMVD